MQGHCTPGGQDHLCRGRSSRRESALLQLPTQAEIRTGDRQSNPRCERTSNRAALPAFWHLRRLQHAAYRHSRPGGCQAARHGRRALAHCTRTTRGDLSCHLRAGVELPNTRSAFSAPRSEERRCAGRLSRKAQQLYRRYEQLRNTETGSGSTAQLFISPI